MLYIPKLVLTDEEDMFVPFAKTEFGAYAPDADEVAFKPLTDEFKVLLNGMDAEVRCCRVSAIPFNRPWPGKQRPYSQTEEAGFVSFVSDGEVCVKVTPKREFKTACVRPLSRGVEVRREGDEISFVLKAHGNYVLELDGSHRALHLFFNEPKERCDSGATYSFGPGIHFPGHIALRSGESVFVHPEAIVFGTVGAVGAQNIRIYGGGVMDGTFEERVTEICYGNHTKGNIRLYDCKGVKIEDVILTNSATWALSLFGCEGVDISCVKIVGQWRYNTDGIDIVNSRKVAVKNSFVRSFDDVVTVKGIYRYGGTIGDILVEGCVFWCGWGNTCEIGIETDAVAYRNITFRDCDVIHTSGPAISVLGGNGAIIENISYENITVEYQSDKLPEVLQTRDAQEYDGYGKSVSYPLLRIDNVPYPIRQRCREKVLREPSEKLGRISGVHISGVRIYRDSDAIRPSVTVICKGDRSNISDICVRDISLNGKRLDRIDELCEIYENFEGLSL